MKKPIFLISKVKIRFRGDTLYVGNLRAGYVTDEPPLRYGATHDAICILTHSGSPAETVKEGKRKLKEMVIHALEKMFGERGEYDTI